MKLSSYFLTLSLLVTSQAFSRDILLNSQNQTIYAATSQEAISATQAKRKKVFTLIGFSAKGYEKAQDVETLLRRELGKKDNKNTIINVGATEVGIGMAYKIAKDAGFETMGIVSSLAIKDKDLTKDNPFAKHVDTIYVIKDETWGGIDPATNKLSATSQAMIGVSSEVLGIGGDVVGRDEMLAAAQKDLVVIFYPTDMLHDVAKKKNISVRGGAEQSFESTPVKGITIEPRI